MMSGRWAGAAGGTAASVVGAGGAAGAEDAEDAEGSMMGPSGVVACAAVGSAKIKSASHGPQWRRRRNRAAAQSPSRASANRPTEARVFSSALAGAELQALTPEEPPCKRS